MDQMMKTGFVRINALRLADILVAYAMFVMQDYLTDVWKLSFTHAAGFLNIWGGVSKMLPLFFLFLADSFLGNFTMLVISTTAYSVGISFLAMSTPPILANIAGTCKRYEPECIGPTQKGLFYTGMALIAVGMAGSTVSLETFLDEEQREENDRDGESRYCWKCVGFILVVVVAMTGAIALPYIKPWSIRFGVPAICTVIGTMACLSGWCDYNKEHARGSPITNICRVFVATACKIRKSFPDNAIKYHKEGEDQLFRPTRFLGCGLV